MRLKTFSFLSAEFPRKANKNNKAGKREWKCTYCNDARKQTVHVFASIDDMYEHWKQNHSIDHREEAAATASVNGIYGPFRFYSVDLLYCQMDSCWYYGTFQTLQRHHEKKHPNKLLVPIRKGRCALCLYSGDGLREHVCDKLLNGMQLKLYNPVLLTNEDLAELQKVESEEMKENRPKKIECQNCGNIFGTREEMTQHHHQQHR